MPFRPFPARSEFRSQEFPGGRIDKSPEGYLVASIDGDALLKSRTRGIRHRHRRRGWPASCRAQRISGHPNKRIRLLRRFARRAQLHAQARLQSDERSSATPSRLSCKSKANPKVGTPTSTELRGRALKLLEQLNYFEIRHAPQSKSSNALRLANIAIDRGIAKKAPAVEATDVGGAASVVPEVNGVVRDGTVRFLGDPLPDGTHVKIHPYGQPSKHEP